MICEHVVCSYGTRPQQLFVTKKGEMPRKAEILKSDSIRDLAVIRTKGLKIRAF